ncbi:cytochrome P450 82C3-like [Morus notabilis]|uniref:cytochrome P450 82C3-like n=1 Tax=Morus notabilis TaxID=981085 RepID=UPI000CED0520|nr:cytochrome P450 82C3-like [Morus notabilis]
MEKVIRKIQCKRTALRLYPSSPIIGLWAAMEDCTLSSGHLVPAGTRLIVNAWKIQRDGCVWQRAGEFEPERFLMACSAGESASELLVAFGGGRRACAGASLALHGVHLALASFLHGFEVERLSGDGGVDMTESAGLTNFKATPLEVLLTPRLRSELYAGL